MQDFIHLEGCEPIQPPLRNVDLSRVYKKMHHGMEIMKKEIPSER